MTRSATEPSTSRPMPVRWCVPSTPRGAVLALSGGHEGLTTPSDAAWKAGAVALRHAPTTTHQTLPPGFVTRLLAVRELGDDADEAQTLEQRSNVMGLLLATCADCHAFRVEHDF